MTRQLNPKDVEDRAYYNGPRGVRGVQARTDAVGAYTERGAHPALPDQPVRRVHRGLQRDERRRVRPRASRRVEGRESPATSRSRTRRATSSSRSCCPPTNVFAYRPRPLKKGDCIPAAGSAASTAPTAGALLVFRLPVAATENRPLELYISAGGETQHFELDL